MPQPALPNPVLATVPPTSWGTVPAPNTIPALASVKQLVGWGMGMAPPLQLSPMERIALQWFGGWLAFGGVVENMSAMAKSADGRWSGGRVTAPSRATCWASDPTLSILYYPDGGGFVKPVKQAAWGSLAYGTGVNAANGNASTAIDLYSWGTAVPPAQVLTSLEIAAFKTQGGGSAWVKVRGLSGTGIIDLTDPRYSKGADGVWQNRNDGASLGMVVDVATRPQNGVAGFVDAVAHDVTADPLGALLFVLVAISAGPALALFLDPLATGVVVAAAVTSPGQVARAAYTLATHPAEIGRTVGGAELVIAGGALGIKGLQKFGAQQIGIGVENSLGGPDLPPPQTGSDLAAEAGGDLGGRPRKWWQIFG